MARRARIFGLGPPAFSTPVNMELTATTTELGGRLVVISGSYNNTVWVWVWKQTALIRQPHLAIFGVSP
jgi:hypothetical protein